MKFKEGENVLRAVGSRGIEDEIRFVYQTEKWDKPAKLIFEELRAVDDVSTLEVRAVDAKGVLCLDARNVVRFGLAGDGRLIDNLGTSITARKVELYNGRALISVQRKGKDGCECVIRGIADSVRQHLAADDTDNADYREKLP